ncbi:MAG: hypothetical protein IJZ42_01735 [Lachnospiraceae bacterium]|nr:hypothetical protein [Lachnospiraceae bacterium]
MSKTLLLTEDVPGYIREIVQNLRPITTKYQAEDIPGYTFNLYGRHKIGYENQLDNDCQKLLKWCQQHHADAYILSVHSWWKDVEPCAGDYRGTKSHKMKAYRERFRNHIRVVITDPVAFRFEKDDFYR